MPLGSPGLNSHAHYGVDIQAWHQSSSVTSAQGVDCSFVFFSFNQLSAGDGMHLFAKDKVNQINNKGLTPSLKAQLQQWVHIQRGKVCGYEGH